MVSATPPTRLVLIRHGQRIEAKVSTEDTEGGGPWALVRHNDVAHLEVLRGFGGNRGR